MIHRPLVVAREAFDGFPAPRDATGAALVDGAVAELVAAANDCRVADCARATNDVHLRLLKENGMDDDNDAADDEEAISRSVAARPRRRVGNSIV